MYWRSNLSISSLAIRIIFLLLPGAIGSSLYWKLKGRATRKDWEDFLEVIIFSLLSYLLYAICTYLLSLLNVLWNRFGFEANSFSHFQAFFDEKAALDFAEVFYASLLSIPLAALASYSYRFKWLNKVGQKIGATTRFGDEDIWDFTFHSPDVRGQWVTVRDHKMKLNYFCWIQAFSDTGKDRELLLRDVDVYNDSTSDCLYKTDVMYLSRKSDELTVEVMIASPEALGEELKASGDDTAKPEGEADGKEAKNEK